VQHVVAAVVGPRALDGQHVERLFDDAQQRGVARIVVADGARVVLGDVEADRAQARALL